LGSTSKNSQVQFCKELFLDDLFQISRCRRPHIYCRYRCDEAIPTKENIINFHCWRDCVKKINSERVLVPKEKPELKSFVWTPEIGSKCDYKASGQKLFVPCYVEKLSVIDKNKFAVISYLTESGQKRTVHIQYPDSNFMKCGYAIHSRSDC